MHRLQPVHLVALHPTRARVDKAEHLLEARLDRRVLERGRRVVLLQRRGGAPDLALEMAELNVPAVVRRLVVPLGDAPIAAVIPVPACGELGGRLLFQWRALEGREVGRGIQALQHDE